MHTINAYKKKNQVYLIFILVFKIFTVNIDIIMSLTIILLFLKILFNFFYFFENESYWISFV